MKNLIYSLFFLLVLVSSCEDRFSQVKVIDFPEHTPQLAITTHMGAEHPDPNFDPAPSVFVGHSLGIVDNKNYDIIDDAFIEFTKDGDPFFDFTYQPSENIHYGPQNIELTEGTYTIKVSASGYESVSATQTMPTKANIISSEFEFEKVPFDLDEDLYDLLKIKIQDPAGEENFYAFDIKLLIKDPNSGDTYENHMYAFSDDPLVEEGDDANEIFPDITFNGNEYVFRLLMQTKWNVQSPDDIEHIIVDVYTLSKDYYFYDTTKYQYWNAQGNPFAEPVLIHNNVEGGYGIFTLNNVVRYIHEL